MFGSQHQKQGSTGSSQSTSDNDVAVGKTALTDHPPVTGSASGKVATSQIVNEITSSAQGLEGTQTATVNAWKQRVESPHKPLVTLKLMAVCKALSTNHHIQDLLAKGPDCTSQIEEVVSTLQGVVGRQIVQAWGDHKDDIAQRGVAWDMFVGGVAQLASNQKQQDSYLAKCLNHDKGYRQTYEATTSILMMGGDEDHGQDDQSPEHKFAEVVRSALAEIHNQNIWTGGQSGGGKKVRDQLQTGMDKASGKTPQAQESMMWAMLIGGLFKASHPLEPDPEYGEVIKTHKAALFETISGIAPDELHAGELDGALEWF